jgi:tetratricopeptide (TPR) repeat protein
MAGILQQSRSKSASGPPPADPPASVWSIRDWLFALALFVTVLLAYQPAWHAGFVWDDDAHVTANPCIVGPLGLKEIWTSGEANYFPLVLTNFWVQHALWGLNPQPYHFVNFILHAAAALLLWRVLRRLRVPGAWLGASLWALHPVQVESVAWISELKNTQSGLIFLLAIWFFLRWVEPQNKVGVNHGIRDYVLALVCAALALLSKPSTVMLPVVLGLCWWWLQDRWSWRNLLWLAPFFALSALASAWTIWEQRVRSGALGGEWAQNWPEHLVIAGKVAWFYPAKLLWPHPLIFIYPRWKIDAPQMMAYFGVLAVAAILLFAWWKRRTWLKSVFFASAYFWVSLVPVLGFFSVYFFRYSFVGDHFQYLASMGPLALAGAAIAASRGLMRAKWSWLEPVAGGALLLGLASLTGQQCQLYADEPTLWRLTLDRNPQCWLAHNNLAKLISPLHPEEALEHYREALRLNPGYAQGHYNLGVTLAQLGRWPEAAVQYETAIELKVDFAEPHFNLANLLSQLGQVSPALAHYETAVRLRPDFGDAHYNLANVLSQQGQVPQALEHYAAAARLSPASAAVHNNLGTALLTLGRVPEAIAQFQEAVRLDPNSPAQHFNLGNALMQLGRAPEALIQFQETLRLEPNSLPARQAVEFARRQVTP